MSKNNNNFSIFIESAAKSKAVLRRICECFLDKSASAFDYIYGEPSEARWTTGTVARRASAFDSASQFYTRLYAVRVIVPILDPYKGNVFETLQSAKLNRGNRRKRWPCASTTTWKLSRMSLAIRGINANLDPRNAGRFRQDLHPDLKADLEPAWKDLANPPFKDSGLSVGPF